MTLQLPFLGGSQHERDQQKFKKQLRPAGHNAFAEWMVGFITPVGSTAMVAIACYVLAQQELARILSGKGQGSDYFVTGLVFVLGAMVDTAVIVTASRFKMHVARGQREVGWAIITGTMLLLCLAVEAMTLMYFAWLVSPDSVPPYIVDAVKHIHDVLFFIRNGLPPLIIAFFTTCLMPLSVETSDRDRAAKASSSLNIAALQEDLVAVGSTATPAEKLTALENQIAVNEHASRATTEEHDRNIALINQLRMNYGLAPRAVQDALTENQAQAMIQQALTQFDANSPLGQFIHNALDQHQADMTNHIQETVAAATQHLAPATAIDAQIREWATSLRDEMTGYVQDLLGPLQEQLEGALAGNATVAFSNKTQGSTGANRTRSAPPTPDDKRFPQWVYTQAKVALRTGPLTQLTLADYLHKTFGVDYTPEAVAAGIQAMRDNRIARLRPGQDLSDDPVLSNPNL